MRSLLAVTLVCLSALALKVDVALPRPDSRKVPDAQTRKEVQPISVSERGRVTLAGTQSSTSLPGTSFITFGYDSSAGGGVAEGGVWNFDQNPGDPFEEWTPVNRTGNDFTGFRRITAASWAGNDNVPPAPLITNAASIWLGFFEDEADERCWVSGLGYGNNWAQRFEGPEATLSQSAPVNLFFNYFLNTEVNYDFVYVLVEQSGTRDTVAVLNGASGTPSGSTPFQMPFMPTPGVPFRVVFEFYSDGSFSDEDGNFTTTLGGFGLDNIFLQAQLGSITPAYAWDFETGLEGWTAQAISTAQSTVDINPLTDYTLDPSCANQTSLSGNGISFHRPGTLDHPGSQTEWTVSPAVGLPDIGGDPRNVFLEFGLYADNFSSLVSFDWGVSYFPVTCPNTGQDVWSAPEFGSSTWIFGSAFCGTLRAFANDFTGSGTENFNGTAFSSGTTWVPDTADSVRFYLQVQNVSGSAEGNFTPLIDNLRIGASNASTVLHVPSVAYPTIQAGLDSAAVGDTVLVAAGRYTGPGNRALTFNGKAIVLLSEMGAEATVIDCENAADGIVLEGPSTPAARVDGFTVRNGVGAGLAGGVTIQSPATIANCIIDSCSGTVGGLISINASITNVVIKNCSSGNLAGGFYNSGGTFVNCEVRDNTGSGVATGGGLTEENGVFIDCAFTGNTGAAVGGVYCTGAGTSLFQGCEFRGNTVNGSPFFAGGAVLVTHQVSFEDCLVTGNYAAGVVAAGGILVASGSNPVALTRCTVSGNRSVPGTSGAGGILAPSLTVTESILIGNETTVGFSDLTGPGALILCSIADINGIESPDAGSTIIQQDPDFCGAIDASLAPTTAGDYTVAASSAALTASCAPRIGALGSGGCFGSAPLITAIEDVPGDQGSYARLILDRSKLDDVGETLTPVARYDVHRRIDSPALVAEVRQSGVRAHSSDVPDQAAWIEYGDRLFVDGSFSPMAAPPGLWEVVASLSARQEDSYTVLVPTLADSGASGVVYSTFFASVHTTIPSIFFDSPADSGYSVDNIAPGIPQNLVFDSPTTLAWDESEANDWQYYTVYGSQNSTFDGSAVSILQTATEGADISGQPYAFFYVTVTDHAGNEGLAAQVASQVGVPGGLVPLVASLRAGYPNPFRAATTVEFDLPAPGRVQLQVFDISGRLVRTLVDQTLPAGRHRAEWSGETESGTSAPGGIYFYRYRAEGFQHTAKVVRVD